MSSQNKTSAPIRSVIIADETILQTLRRLKSELPRLFGQSSKILLGMQPKRTTQKVVPDNRRSLQSAQADHQWKKSKNSSQFRCLQCLIVEWESDSPT